MNKSVNFKPERMNTVNPYLMVEDVEELVRFATDILGAILVSKLHRPDGQIMHVELKMGDSMIMGGTPMDDFGAAPSSLYVYVKDCDQVFSKAIEFGCRSIMQPETMVHAGERYGGVQDKNGTIWWIATHVEDLTPEEQAKRIDQMNENWST